MITASRWLSYRGRFLPIGRASFRKTLTRGRAQRSPEILLPKYVTVHELRLMLRTTYPGCLRACGVSVARSSYAWSDQEGRKFRCYNKRHVLVPFELAALASRSFGFQAIHTSPEPPSPERCVNSRAIPVVTIVGHKDHGKTTLMERLTGERFVDTEPGDTTQHIITRPVSLQANGEQYQMTLLDTPGDELFEILRGRAIHLADVAIVVISAEGGELQTRDVILQADRFRVPLIFCINKADLEFHDVEVAKAELRQQCHRMHMDGLISTDLRTHVNSAIPISAISGKGIDSLALEIVNSLKHNRLPVNAVELQDPFGGAPLKNLESFIRRTNSLVTSGAPPIAVGFILDIEKTHSFGVVATLVIRHGTLIEGSYFVAGTEYGRVSGIYPAHLKLSPCNQIDRATVGSAVRITGLQSMQGTSADDMLLIMPQHDAFRLSQYRKDVQLLRAHQIEGPPIRTPWAVLLKAKAQNDYNITEEYDQLEQDLEQLEQLGDQAEPPLASIYLKPTTDDADSSNDPSALPSSQQPLSFYDTTLNEATIPDSPQSRLSATPDERGAPSDPEEDQWSAKVYQKNKALQERWLGKLKISLETKRGANVHSGLRPPKITPGMGRPVISLVLRANFVGMFDALLDGFEALEKKHNVRISVVHGGLGPIIPGDIVQADVGNKFGFCPVYAFQVPVLNDAVKHAVINRVTVKKFNVYSDLLNDVERRCERVIHMENEARENEALRG